MAVLARTWPADFVALTEVVPDGGILHQAIEASIDPKVVQAIDIEQTSVSTGLVDIVTDIALSGPEIAAVDIILDAHTGVATTGEDVTYTCPLSLGVGDLVYLTGDTAIDKADNAAESTGPVIGIVVSKPTTTTAQIKSSGAVDGLTGMTAGEEQFLGTNGNRIESGALPTAVGSVVQHIGVAVSATTIKLALKHVVIL